MLLFSNSAISQLLPANVLGNCPKTKVLLPVITLALASKWLLGSCPRPWAVALVDTWDYLGNCPYIMHDTSGYWCEQSPGTITGRVPGIRGRVRRYSFTPTWGAPAVTCWNVDKVNGIAYRLGKPLRKAPAHHQRVALTGVYRWVTRSSGSRHVRCEDDNAVDALRLEGRLNHKANGTEFRIRCADPASDVPVYPLGIALLDSPATSRLELLWRRHRTSRSEDLGASSCHGALGSWRHW